MEEARKYDVTRMPEVSENPYASPYYGLWYKEIPCGDTLRRYYLYTPESYFPQMRNLSIFLPEGMGAEEFLEKSPWAGISEKESVLLILLVPGEGGYADTESEEAYYRVLTIWQDTVYGGQPLAEEKLKEIEEALSQCAAEQYRVAGSLSRMRMRLLGIR